MSRTYRRVRQHKNKRWNDDLRYYVSEWVRSPSGWLLYRRQFPTNSIEYKKGKARYHSDAGSHCCKEPGPRWFRNIFAERPNRRKTKAELRKFMLNKEYEPIITSKPRLPYWT